MSKVKVSVRQTRSWRARLATFAGVFGIAWLFLEPIPTFLGESFNFFSTLNYWGYLILVGFSVTVTIFVEVLEMLRDNGKRTFTTVALVFSELGETWEVEVPRDLKVSSFLSLVLEKAARRAPEGSTLSVLNRYDTRLVVQRGKREEVISNELTLAEAGLTSEHYCKVQGTIKNEFQQVYTRTQASYDSFQQGTRDNKIPVKTRTVTLDSAYDFIDDITEDNTFFIADNVLLNALSNVLITNNYTRRVKEAQLVIQEYYINIFSLLPKGVTRAVIFLPEENGLFLQPFGYASNTSSDLRGLRFYIGKEPISKGQQRGLAGEAYLSKQVVVAHLFKEGERWTTDNEAYVFVASPYTQPKYTSIAVFPLQRPPDRRSEGRVLGVASYESIESESFDTLEAQRVLTTITNRIALVIDILQYTR